MRDGFIPHYLVCLDFDPDMNYVISRHSVLEEARDSVRNVRRRFPNYDVYLTQEMVLRQNPQIANSLVDMGLEYSYNPKKKCGCGKSYGKCVGDLSCRCNPIDECKRVDDRNKNALGDSEIDSEDDFEDYEDDLEEED